MERFKMIASGYVFFIRSKKILLSKRLRTGYWDGFYSLPAGHIEDNEALTQGTIREVKEETGIRLSVKNMTLVHVMHRKENDIRMDFFFLAKQFRGEPKNTEPEKCSDLRWFPLKDLPENICPYIKTAIRHYRHGKFFSEFGWKRRK